MEGGLFARITLLPPLPADCLLLPPLPILNPPAAGAAEKPGANPPPCDCCCIGAPKPEKAGAGAEGVLPNGGTGEGAPLPKPPNAGPEVDAVEFDAPNAKGAGAEVAGFDPNVIVAPGAVVVNEDGTVEPEGEGAPNENVEAGVDAFNADVCAGVVPAVEPNENDGAGDGAD